MRILDLFMGVETNMRYASSPRLALETACMRACVQTNDVDSNALLERIAELEHKINDMEKAFSEGAVPQKRTASGDKTQSSVRTPPAVERVVSGSELDIWKAAMEFLKRTAPGKHGILAQGKFLGVQNGKYRWTPNGGEPGPIAILNQDSNRKQIAQALTDAAGTACTFEAVGADAKIERMGDAEAVFLDNLRETFGAENVSVQDQPKT